MSLELAYIHATAIVIYAIHVYHLQQFLSFIVILITIIVSSFGWKLNLGSRQ